MRKDLEIHIQSGDIALRDSNTFTLRPFSWVDGSGDDTKDLEQYIYGEIQVPYIVNVDTIREQGIYVPIPYTPKYKEFKLRIRRVRNNGSYEDIPNLVNPNTAWHIATSAVYGGEFKNVFASTLPQISESHFYIRFDNGAAQIYSCSNTDFNVVKADRQNANCLLACVPGCNLRYPLTGVGLMRWINSTNVVSTKLTTILEDEFAADGMNVRNASYNYDTHQMELDLKPSEGEEE